MPARDAHTLMKFVSAVRSRWYWGLALGAVIVLSLIGAIITYVFYQSSRAPVSFWTALTYHLPTWIAWTLTIPVLIALAEQFPIGRQHRWRNIAVHVMAMPLFHVVLSVLTALLLIVLVDSPRAQPATFWSPRILLRVDPVFTIVLYVCFAAVIHLRQQTKLLRVSMTAEAEAARREVEMAAMLADARAAALRLQLRPHFLYNTLNTIGAIVLRDPAGARAVLTHLADMLRRVLRDEDQQEWTLREEISFLNDYVAIQKVRFRDMLMVEVQVENALLDSMVPCMLLQPLVENAIQHGVPIDGASRIAVCVRRRQTSLELAVRDNGRGFDNPSTASRGIGLRNTRERLALLYDDKARLDVTNHADGGAEVIINIVEMRAVA
jgi:two-component system LytT family sensor kinase